MYLIEISKKTKNRLDKSSVSDYNNDVSWFVRRTNNYIGFSLMRTFSKEEMEN